MTTPYRDPWAILGLDRSAEDKEIKTAYRKLALQYHPDKNKDKDSKEIESRFADIARAYEDISTADKRTKWLSENESLASPFANQPETNFPDLEDFNSEKPTRANSTTSVTHPIEISFIDSFKGAQVNVSIEVEDICSVCGGSGAASGYTPVACDVCQGTGQHHIGRTTNTCSACRGEGFVIEKPCPRCKNGLITETRPFVVQIPPGATPGYQIRLNEQRRGRLVERPIIVHVAIEESSIFQRTLNDPADLMIDVPISYSEAVLGATIKIPTPSKVVKLTIPQGTTSGKIFRIKGDGMPRLDNPEERGNLYARSLITVPANVSKEELNLIYELSKFQPNDLRYHLFNQ